MMDRETWLRRILEATRDLADERYQERVWVRGEGPEVELEHGSHLPPRRRLRPHGLHRRSDEERLDLEESTHRAPEA